MLGMNRGMGFSGEGWINEVEGLTDQIEGEMGEGTGFSFTGDAGYRTLEVEDEDGVE